MYTFTQSLAEIGNKSKMDIHIRIGCLLILNFILLTTGIFAQNELNLSVRKPIPFFKGYNNKLDNDWNGLINLDCYYSYCFYRDLSAGIGLDYGNCRLILGENTIDCSSYFYTPYVCLRYRLTIFNNVFISPKFNFGYSFLKLKFNDGGEGFDTGFNLTSQFDIGLLIKNRISISLSGTYNLIFNNLIPFAKIWIYEYNKHMQYSSCGISIGYIIGD
jgi:hypothetical protein